MPTMTPVDRGLAAAAEEEEEEEDAEGLAVVSASVDEGAGVMSDVAGIVPVSGTSVVDGEIKSDVSEGVVVGLPVVMVVCLVIVTMELLGMVWVMPESVMVADFLDVGVGRDEVDSSSLCRPWASSSVGVGFALSGSGCVFEGMGPPLRSDEALKSTPSGHERRAHGSVEQHPLNRLATQE